MEKKRAIGLVLLLVVLGAFAWAMLRPHEPMYDGKPLSFWLERYDPVNFDETSEQQADHALEAIGTNAIPTLLRMIQAEDTQLKLRLMALFKKQHILKIKWKSAGEQIEESVKGFAALGGEAKIAVPTLMDLYKRDSSYYSRNVVLAVLDDIGPAAKEAVPSLVASLADPNDEEHHDRIILTIASIHGYPDCAVPALIKCLQHGNKIEDPMYTLLALGAYGQDAKPAVPAIIKFIKDEDVESRRYHALEALKKIDPSAAAKVRSELGTGPE